MSFIKRQFPLIVCFIMGVVFAIQYYVPHQTSEDFLTTINDWLITIGIFGSLLGLYSISHLHLVKIKRRVSGWGFSTVVLIGLVATLIVGIISQGETVTKEFTPTSFGWVYNNMLATLNATVFSILAFFIASVAFRTFRAKNFEAILLLLAAVIVMFGRVPLGEYLWNEIFKNGFDIWIPFTGITHIAPIPMIREVVDWIMDNPNMAARRGILLGVMLGAIATSLKIILGIERAYLGGDKK